MISKTHQNAQLILLAITGSSLAAGETNPVTLQPSRAQIEHVAHIYYNAITGERVATLLADQQTSPADTGSSEAIWATPVQNACASQGYSTEFIFGFDNPNSTSLSWRATLLDYGDIALDTVVDCIQVNWATLHPDTDMDSDGVGDGVEELAAQWIIWDADNGRAVNQSTRLPVMNLILFNLPGDTTPNQSGRVFSEYTMDIDLVAFGTATNLSFELGDSDGDCQTAAFCNNDVDGMGTPIANADRDFDGLPDSDLDGDGLFDWSWTVRFFQPGTGNDFDSDLDTGDRPSTQSDTIGVSFGFPEGSATDNGDGTWAWEIDRLEPDAGTGQEDRFALYSPPYPNGDIIYAGGYWFGGFACTGGLISTGGLGYTPPAMFQFTLYGPFGFHFECGDYNGDQAVNFFDVSDFIEDFINMDRKADLNADGVYDYFDVSLFLLTYNSAGCP